MFLSPALIPGRTPAQPPLQRQRLHLALWLASGASLSACGGGASETAAGSSTPASERPDSGEPSLPAATSLNAPLAPTPLPRWRVGQAIGEWRALPGSALMRTPPSITVPGNTGPRAKLDAGCGLALDPRTARLYCAANGGHGDYAGNEVNVIDLYADAPAWEELRASTPPEAIIASTSHYADGRPSARHSYYGISFNRARERVMVMGGARWGDGALNHTMDGFDPTGQDWDPPHTFSDIPANSTPDHGQAWVTDPRTGDLYAFSNWTISHWSSQTNQWALRVANSPIHGVAAAAALDTRRERIFVLGGSSYSHDLFDLASNRVDTQVLSGPSANARALLRAQQDALVYIEALDAYLLRNGEAGGGLYRIDAQTFHASAWPTTGGQAIPMAPQGVWSRFQAVPQLGGVIYAPSSESELWFLRTN